MKNKRNRKKNLTISEGRHYYGAKKYAHFVWDEHNPDNLRKKGMVIHHKDGDSLNDDINNLEMITLSEHIKIHHIGVKRPLETCEKISEKAKLRIGDKNPFYGKTHSEESRKKMSEKQKGKIITEETKKKMSETHKKRHALRNQTIIL